jgi:hypothetical protein
VSEDEIEEGQREQDDSQAKIKGDSDSVNILGAITKGSLLDRGLWRMIRERAVMRMKRQGREVWKQRV